MARSNKKNIPSKKIQTATIFQVIIFFVLVGISCLFYLSSIDQKRHIEITQQTETTRDKTVTNIQTVLSQYTQKLDLQLKKTDVQDALSKGDIELSIQTLSKEWPESKYVMIWPDDLQAAYASTDTFGYSRLSLLETAIHEKKAVVHVVNDTEQGLGIAAPITLGNEIKTPAIVYVRLPINVLLDKLKTVHIPESAYLALRQGRFTVYELGNKSIVESADRLARKINDNGLQIAVAIPEYSRPLFSGVSYSNSFILSISTIILAFLFLIFLKTRYFGLLKIKETIDNKYYGNEPTLQQRVLSDPEPETDDKTFEIGTIVSWEEPVSTKVPGHIFRMYDIRGLVGKDLTIEHAMSIGQAIGNVMSEQFLTTIIVGQDGRTTSPALTNSLIMGLQKAGCTIIDIGLVPTPAAYFAEYQLNADACVIVTGSHNPVDENGFKICINKKALYGDAIFDLSVRINSNKLVDANLLGPVKTVDILPKYIQTITTDVVLKRRLKVVIDAGNGAGSIFAPKVLEALNAEVIPIFCEVDGTFPNHHPDPSIPNNLKSLIDTVKNCKADLGIAFDGDADRLGVVTETGEFIFSDRLLMLFANDILSKAPRSSVIFDVKCTNQLFKYIQSLGGKPIMAPTGHSLIKAKMDEDPFSILAGELTGHFYFKDRWPGFDDGIYAAARLLEILSNSRLSLSELLNTLPNCGVSTTELRIPTMNTNAHLVISTFITASKSINSPFANAHISNIDGFRADWEDGWGLIRASNTSAELVLRFEANDKLFLEQIKNAFNHILQSIDSKLPIIF